MMKYAILFLKELKSNKMSDFKFDKIAVVRNCFNEKFGIPRQSGLVENVESVIELIAPYDHEDYVRELDGFSHIWLVFVFHQHIGKDVKATVRPPRLGGNKRIGVYASRSPFRPNPVGLSVVKLNRISTDKKKIRLYVSGADLMNGTPIIDIKPYINYADSIPEAESSYATDKPIEKLKVIFSNESQLFIETVKNSYPSLQNIIYETLSLDPRPAYIDDDSKQYAISLFEFNVKWRVVNNVAEVVSIENLS